MKAYSEDLRQRIVEAIDRGMCRAEVVATFRVSLATIKRYLKQRRETGQLTVKRRPGRPAAKGVALAAQVDQLLTHAPDASLADLCQRWAAISGVVVSSATMSRVVRRQGWTRKKRRWVRQNAMNSNVLPSATGSRSDPPTPM